LTGGLRFELAEANAPARRAANKPKFEKRRRR
jgi:hypothetical protein